MEIFLGLLFVAAVIIFIVDLALIVVDIYEKD